MQKLPQFLQIQTAMVPDKLRVVVKHKLWNAGDPLHSPLFRPPLIGILPGFPAMVHNSGHVLRVQEMEFVTLELHANKANPTIRDQPALRPYKCHAPSSQKRPQRSEE